MTQKDLNRMMGQPHAALETQDGYVEKVTGNNRVYTNNSNGEPDSLEYSATVKASTIPVRNAAGNIYTANPTSDAHATTKKYVDESIKNAVPSTTPLLVMLNSYSKDIVDFVINDKPEGGLTSPFIMFDVGDGTESSQPPLAVSNIFFVNAEYIPGGDVDGHIINIWTPDGLYYCTDTSGSFEYTV